MEATSPSLLRRAALGATDAWSQLDRLYRPFLLNWFFAHGSSPADAEDLTQDVMTVVFEEVKDFAHSGRVGAFRTWLRGVCLHRFQADRRSRQLRGAATGGTEFQMQLHNLADSGDDPADDWDREHDALMLREMLANLATAFEEKSLRAFGRLVFDGVAAPQVAAELGMSVGAVYIAKSRVLRRLRAEAAGLIGKADLN
jgi:RNA polymerase sigma-70 factor (ECF subfamily)